jgi:hypothetical protein
MISKQYRWSSIGMLLTCLAFSVLFPLYILNEREGWIWTFPARNEAMEHMLVVNYFVTGLFFLYGARDPVRFLPLIDLTILMNVAHATMMLFDALRYPGHESHLRPGGDVMGTYLTPVILMLTHPKQFYIPWLQRKL